MTRDSDGGVDAYRAQLERSFIGSYQDDLEIGRFDGSLPLRVDVGDSLRRTVDDDDEWSLDAMSACGDDCEECLIPDELKVLLDWEKDIDVMAFLGIQRAEPLRLHTNLGAERDWD